MKIYLLRESPIDSVRELDDADLIDAILGGSLAFTTFELAQERAAKIIRSELESIRKDSEDEEVEVDKKYKWKEYRYEHSHARPYWETYCEYTDIGYRITEISLLNAI